MKGKKKKLLYLLVPTGFNIIEIPIDPQSNPHQIPIDLISLK